MGKEVYKIVIRRNDIDVDKCPKGALFVSMTTLL